MPTSPAFESTPADALMEVFGHAPDPSADTLMDLQQLNEFTQVAPQSPDGILLAMDADSPLSSVPERSPAPERSPGPQLLPLQELERFQAHKVNDTTPPPSSEIEGRPPLSPQPFWLRLINVRDQRRRLGLRRRRMSHTSTAEANVTL